MACADCSSRSTGLPLGKILGLIIIVAIVWFSVAHAVEGHGDTGSWAAKEAARNNPCWQGTNPAGRIATVGQYNKNGDDVFGVCFDEPGVDGMEYITSYQSRKTVLQDIIDALIGGGFK